MIFSASALFCAKTRALSWSSLKVPERLQLGRQLDTGHHRILRVALGEVALRLRRHQVLEELHRHLLVGRVARHRAAADVDVRAAVRPGWGTPTPTLAASSRSSGFFERMRVDVVVGVGDADLGFARGDALDLVGVAAARRARQVGRDCPWPMPRSSPVRAPRAASRSATGCRCGPRCGSAACPSTWGRPGLRRSWARRRRCTFSLL